MIYKCRDGVERDVSVEVIEDGVGDCVFSSSLKEATPELIQQIVDKGCNHQEKRDQLIYDIEGWMYDNRYCAICGEWLGGI